MTPEPINPPRSAAHSTSRSKPGRGPWTAWDAEVRLALAERYDLAGGESLIGDWRLGVWRLTPRAVGSGQ